MQRNNAPTWAEKAADNLGLGVERVVRARDEFEDYLAELREMNREQGKQGNG